MDIKREKSGQLALLTKGNGVFTECNTMQLFLRFFYVHVYVNDCLMGSIKAGQMNMT